MVKAKRGICTVISRNQSAIFYILDKGELNISPDTDGRLKFDC